MVALWKGLPVVTGQSECGLSLRQACKVSIIALWKIFYHRNNDTGFFTTTLAVSICTLNWTILQQLVGVVLSFDKIWCYTSPHPDISIPIPLIANSYVDGLFVLVFKSPCDNKILLGTERGGMRGLILRWLVVGEVTLQDLKAASALCSRLFVTKMTIMLQFSVQCRLYSAKYTVQCSLCLVCDGREKMCSVIQFWLQTNVLCHKLGRNNMMVCHVCSLTWLYC